MTDTAPVSAPASASLINWFRFGRTNPTVARRGVSLNRINNIQGDDWGDVPSDTRITTPLSDGCTNLIIDGPFGSLPTETIRYQAGKAITGTLHGDAYLRAANGTDGYPTPAWLTTAMGTGMAALTAAGLWWGIYCGKWGYPTHTPTTGSPRYWPVDLSDSAYDSLTNWRAMYEPAFANGCGFVVNDADATALSSEPAALFQTVCENIASHTGSSLGNTSYTGTFTNDRVRRWYAEAVPPASSWQHSFVALWNTYDASVGVAGKMQAADCTHPPIVVCIKDATQEALYNKAVAYLALGTVHVAVDYMAMRAVVGETAMKSLLGLSATAITAATPTTVYLPGRRESWGGRAR